jgi:hypothetical protein
MPGHGRHPPLVERCSAAGRDHRAPFRQRRLGAEAEETEAGGVMMMPAMSSVTLTISERQRSA